METLSNEKARLSKENEALKQSLEREVQALNEASEAQRKDMAELTLQLGVVERRAAMAENLVQELSQQPTISQQLVLSNGNEALPKSKDAEIVEPLTARTPRGIPSEGLARGIPKPKGAGSARSETGLAPTQNMELRPDATELMALQDHIGDLQDHIVVLEAKLKVEKMLMSRAEERARTLQAELAMKDNEKDYLLEELQKAHTAMRTLKQIQDKPAGPQRPRSCRTCT